jgi:hypothetical protein
VPAIIAAIAGTGSLKFAPETRYIPPGAGEMEPDGEDWVVPGRRYIIKRPRLTRLLDGSKARVRMLIAPAGFGGRGGAGRRSGQDSGNGNPVRG